MANYETRLQDVAASPRVRFSGTGSKSWILWPRTTSATDIARGVVFARLSPRNAEAWAKSLGGRLPTLEEARAAARSAESIILAFKAWPKTDTLRTAEATAWFDGQIAKSLGYLPRGQTVFGAKAWLALSPWNPPDGRAPPRPTEQRSENWGAWKRDGRPDELYQPGGWGSQEHDREWTDYSQIPIAIIDT